MLDRHAARLACALTLAVLLVACSGDRPTAPRNGSTAGTATGTGTGTDAGGGSGTPVAAACTPDATAPAITGTSATPNVLWPPNHKLVAVTATATASDECDPNPRCAISSVSSNEPVNGLGDGDTAPDWFVAGATTLWLRAERSGLGTGRVYTIGLTCTDAAGNASSGSTTVLVPHDQRG